MTTIGESSARAGFSATQQFRHCGRLSDGHG